MSSSETSATSKLFSFEARSEDAAVELFLIDARMQMVARGRRELNTQQPLGVYTLKLRAGPTTREEIILIDRDMVHPVKPLEFASAVPLEATSGTLDYQQSAALRQSGEVNVKLGTGASIFVFAREDGQGSGVVNPSHHPAEALTLCSEQGEKLVDFQTESNLDMSGEPWAACRVGLKPGLYRLAVRAATGEFFEMAIPAMPGFFVKVFLVQREEQGSGWGRRPDLARASILLSKKEHFDKDSVENRLAEIAKLALVDRRRVYASDMDGFLKRKFENPMLGILGGHLLLLEEQVNTGLLRIVVQNLRNVLIHPHPDVEALALAAGLPTSHRFTMPPMLRASWQIVLDHSVRDPKLVPIGSLAASLATLVTQQDPWLIWCRPGTKRQTEQRHKDIASFIKLQLKPSLISAMTKTLMSKKPSGIPAVDEFLGQLNLPPSTVAHLVERFLSTTATTGAKKSNEASPKGLVEALKESSELSSAGLNAVVKEATEASTKDLLEAVKKSTATSSKALNDAISKSAAASTKGLIEAVKTSAESPSTGSSTAAKKSAEVYAKGLLRAVEKSTATSSKALNEAVSKSTAASSKGLIEAVKKSSESSSAGLKATVKKSTAASAKGLLEAVKKSTATTKATAKKQNATKAPRKKG